MTDVAKGGRGSVDCRTSNTPRILPELLLPPLVAINYPYNKKREPQR